MTDEEILDDALRAVPEYLAIIGKDGDFSLETCMRHCLTRVKNLYQRSTGALSRSGPTRSGWTMTGGRVDELTRLFVRLDAPLRERIEPVRQRFLKRRAVFRISRTTAESLIPAAFREAGLQAVVTGQQYRARVEVTLPGGNHLRFYIRYKDMMKDGVIDDVVTAVTDLREVLTRLGGAVSIKKS